MIAQSFMCLLEGCKSDRADIGTTGIAEEKQNNFAFLVAQAEHIAVSCQEREIGHWKWGSDYSAAEGIRFFEN